MNVAVGVQEIFDLSGFVRREVVGDHVDFFATRLIDHDVSQERDELGRGVTRRGLAQHLSGFGIEGGVKRERAMPVVFEAVPLSPPWGQWQDRVEPVERLDGGLLVYAKYRSMLRRMQIQRNDVGGLLLEVGIIRGDIAFESVRSQSMLSLHTRDTVCREPTSECTFQ